MHRSFRIAASLAMALLLSACANQNARDAAELVNQQLIQSGSPYRWETEPVSGGTMMNKVLIGTPGQTAADVTLQRDIVAQIANASDERVSPGDRPREVRVVSQSSTAVEEVWVFANGDKDLIYVIALSTSNTGGTDIRITGPW